MLSALLRGLTKHPVPSAISPGLHTSSVASAGIPRSAKREEQIREQQSKREKWQHLKASTHRMRLSSIRGGRSGGGQSQQMEARLRRSRDQRAKFDGARDFVNRTTVTQKERALAEARILRQRSRQLKKRGAPGMGFTPARFRLMPVENESGSDLGALVGAGDVAEAVAKASFDNLGLSADVAGAARRLLVAAQRTGSLRSEDELRPTEIQALGIPEILGCSRLGKQKRISGLKAGLGPNVFLAAETGGGKTLAYALPLMTQLKQEELDAAKEQGALDKLRRERRPRALVVVPSRELVKQVTATFKQLGHSVKLRTVGMHLGVARRILRESIDNGPIDILVSTPGAVLRYMQRDAILSPSNIRRLVVDEADSMMDSHSFGDQSTKVLDLVHRANATQGLREQAVFVSATLPKLIRETIIQRYPDVVHVTTQQLHRAPQKLAQTFIDVSRDYQGHRLNALWFVLRTAANDRHLLIFCNTKDHANVVYRQLFRRGVPALLLVGSDNKTTRDRIESVKQDAANRQPVTRRRPPKDADAWEKAVWTIDEPHQTEATPSEQEAEPEPEPESEPINGVDIADLNAPIPRYDRDEVLRAFYSDEPIPAHLLPSLASKEPVEKPLLDPMVQQRFQRKIMVCTDLASRGLDTTCVSHVVLFDFPTTAIDYLHRTGRTARAGTRGKVSALVGKKDRRLADQIRLAIRQGGVI
ncbi:hypothetical protein LPJ64_001960 [Coemansia asiatica]|uniref:P-loop containing nucleoside triphosphate hydrolase protein n=1 Tax=Coemansia asiatica TaxID=1052880 RepID=A0A9W7XN19_9FUNG|nr:hypothetical protein LPJ64_001960 [Coemansia asiatica]